VHDPSNGGVQVMPVSRPQVPLPLATLGPTIRAAVLSTPCPNTAQLHPYSARTEPEASAPASQGGGDATVNHMSLCSPS
jgi:hypothetical protein